MREREREREREKERERERERERGSERKTYDSTIRVLVILLVGRVTLFPRNRVLRNWGLLVSEECEPRSLVPLFFTTSLNLAVINSGPFQMEKDESYALSSF
ncbi:MAG: hypothetical protein VYC44_02800 [Chloroflexota bacterium]|nr:hypothetical protein [Chloroflexota bacterium]